MKRELFIAGLTVRWIIYTCAFVIFCSCAFSAEPTDQEFDRLAKAIDTGDMAAMRKEVEGLLEKYPDSETLKKVQARLDKAREEGVGEVNAFAGRQHATAAPLNDVQVKTLLESGFSPAEVKAEVEKSGYAGKTDPTTLGTLRNAGADAGLVALLLKGGVTAPAQPGLADDKRFAGNQAGERRVLQVNGLEVAFRWCPPGNFTMGQAWKPEDIMEDFNDDEQPVEVRLSQGFWMAEAECTRELWAAVMGDDPDRVLEERFKKRPHGDISWEEAQGFLDKLNQSNVPADGWKWALPTEAQWEYACRAGTKTRFAFGNSLVDGRDANFDGKNEATNPVYRYPTPVGKYPPNAWGLYDMHGNVSEWCADWYAKRLAGGLDPVGPLNGTYRVHRGGSWCSSFEGFDCRSAKRMRGAPDSKGSEEEMGFRPALVPSK